MNLAPEWTDESTVATSPREVPMLKTMLAIAVLTVVQLPAAYAGARGVIYGGGPAGSGWGNCCSGGLPAHNGGGGDVKNNGGGMTGTGQAGAAPLLLRPGYIPPKIRGPFPGPIPDPRPRTL